MTDTNVTVAPARTAEIRGRASGVSILAFFALVWTGWGTSNAVAGTSQALTVVAAAVLSAVLIALAWGRYRRADAVRSDQATPTHRPSWGRRFGQIVAAEWIGLGIVAFILGATGHEDAIPAVISLGVGIHFFPLARLFHVPVYLLTGALLCLIAVTTLILAPLTSTTTLWTALPGFGSAIVLYATCARLLTENRQ